MRTVLWIWSNKLLLMIKCKASTKPTCPAVNSGTKVFLPCGSGRTSAFILWHAPSRDVSIQIPPPLGKNHNYTKFWRDGGARKTLHAGTISPLDTLWGRSRPNERHHSRPECTNRLHQVKTMFLKAFLSELFINLKPNWFVCSEINIVECLRCSIENKCCCVKTLAHAVLLQPLPEDWTLYFIWEFITMITFHLYFSHLHTSICTFNPSV